MRRFETIVVAIQRDYDKAYALLADPRNYPRWSPVPDALFQPIDNDRRNWLVDLPRGRRVLRFTPLNDFGVLDYSVYLEDGTYETTSSVRLVPNEDGCVLVVSFFKRDELSDEEFESEVRWAENDFKAIASAIEAL